MDIKKYLEYYRNNPVPFAEDVLGLELSEQQVLLLNTLQSQKYVAVKSGHGTGKSFVSSVAILWFLSTRYMAQVPTTAPTSSQLNDVLWSRLSENFYRMNPIFRENFTMVNDRIYHNKYKKSWFTAARTAKKETPEALQGFHAKNLLFVIDEAAGVPDEVFQVVMGALTETGNMCLMIGNPTRLSGYFYDAFHKNRGRWANLTLNSEDSPFVSQDWIKEMAINGRNSNIYRMRVIGEFPKQEDDTLIELDLLDNAIEREITPSGGVVWGVDVARFGKDETVLVKRQANKLLKIKRTKQRDTMEVSGWVKAEYHRSEPKPDKICVDVIGIGAGVYDRLREQGIPVIPVQVSERANDPEKYKNVRAEIYDLYRHWLLYDEPSIPNDTDLIAQSSTIKYKYDSAGRMMIESKDDYKKRNPSIGSPDIVDAVTLTFYRKIQVIPQVLWI